MWYLVILKRTVFRNCLGDKKGNIFPIFSGSFFRGFSPFLQFLICFNVKQGPKEDHGDLEESQGRGAQGSLGAPWLSPGSPWSSLGPSLTLKQIRNCNIVGCGSRMHSTIHNNLAS